MQTDLYLLGPSVAPVTRDLLADWASTRGCDWLLMREWPQARLWPGAPAFDDVLLLTWPRAAPVAGVAAAARQAGDAAGLLRLNYDMRIDGVLFERAQRWAGCGMSGVASNLQPHGGAAPVHADLGRWLAPRLGCDLVDPLCGRWSPDSGRFVSLAGWRPVLAGSLANPARHLTETAAAPE